MDVRTCVPLLSIIYLYSRVILEAHGASLRMQNVGMQKL